MLPLFTASLFKWGRCRYLEDNATKSKVIINVKQFQNESYLNSHFKLFEGLRVHFGCWQ